jgi:hypothetical protein
MVSGTSTATGSLASLHWMASPGKTSLSIFPTSLFWNPQKNDNEPNN